MSPWTAAVADARPVRTSPIVGSTSGSTSK
jgi:hypothetical protein